MIRHISPRRCSHTPTQALIGEGYPEERAFSDDSPMKVVGLLRNAGVPFTTQFRMGKYSKPKSYKVGGQAGRQAPTSANVLVRAGARVSARCLLSFRHSRHHNRNERHDCTICVENIRYASCDRCLSCFIAPSGEGNQPRTRKRLQTRVGLRGSTNRCCCFVLFFLSFRRGRSARRRGDARKKDRSKGDPHMYVSTSLMPDTHQDAVENGAPSGESLHASNLSK